MVNDYRIVFRSDLYAGNASTRSVLLHIALQQRPDTGCYTSTAEMAAGLGISRRTVVRALTKAETDGVLRKHAERDHLGHKIVQRWVVTERFKAAQRETHAPSDDARPMRHSEYEPCATGDKPMRQTDETHAPPDGAGLVKTRLDKSISKSDCEKRADYAPSAEIEKIMITDKSYSLAEWQSTARKRTDFGARIAWVTYSDGRKISALIRFDDSQWKHFLSATNGGQVLA